MSDVDKPYGTWGKGPSPKEVYKAFSDTYVGYVPLGVRIVMWHRNHAFATDVSMYGGFRASQFNEFSCVTKLDGLLGDITHFSYVCDNQKTFTREPLTNGYIIEDQPRWRMFFVDTLKQYPRAYRDNSFYLFEDFVINDDHDVLQWAKYARKATWRALGSLDDLPKRG